MRPKHAITEDEFASWRSSPMTEFFMAYLADKARDVRRCWYGGDPQTPGQGAAVDELEGVVHLGFEQIVEFYEIEREEDESRWIKE